MGGCVVYDSDLVSDGSGLSGSGNTGAESGRAGMASGGTSSAGKTGTSGGKANGGTGSTSGGTPMVDGGAPAEEGGAGNDPVAGTGGSGGAGGTPAAAGTGGSGGKAGDAGSGGKGGSAGGGGMPSTVKCSDHPLTLKATWEAAASISSLGNGMESDGLYNPPSHLIDANISERWSTGKPQSGDEWFQIDFGAEVTLSQITMQLGTNPNDWPRGYAIRVSNLDAVTNVAAFSAPVLASGVGAMSTDVVVSLADPVNGRYLLVRQTGVVEPPAMSWWTIAEVLVGCVD